MTVDYGDFQKGRRKAGAGAQKEKEEKKKRAGRLHTFSCKETFIGFIYPLNLCCGFMPLKTIFPIKIEVFLTNFANAIFSLFSTCMRN